MGQKKKDELRLESRPANYKITQIMIAIFGYHAAVILNGPRLVIKFVFFFTFLYFTLFFCQYNKTIIFNLRSVFSNFLTSQYEDVKLVPKFK